MNECHDGSSIYNRLTYHAACKVECQSPIGYSKLALFVFFYNRYRLMSFIGNADVDCFKERNKSSRQGFCHFGGTIEVPLQCQYVPAGHTCTIAETSTTPRTTTTGCTHLRQAISQALKRATGTTQPALKRDSYRSSTVFVGLTTGLTSSGLRRKKRLF